MRTGAYSALNRCAQPGCQGPGSATPPHPFPVKSPITLTAIMTLRAPGGAGDEPHQDHHSGSFTPGVSAVFSTRVERQILTDWQVWWLVSGGGDGTAVW
jgi:hypothetical protein